MRQIDLDGTQHFSSSSGPSITISLTSVRETAPVEFKLHQNYPNPFNPSTEFKFSVEARGRTTLRVYNLLGEEVATLFDGTAEAGQYYRVKMDGSNLGSGVYFSRLESGNKNMLKKIMLVK